MQKKGIAPTQFLTHVYCGQMARWMKMPLGMEVGLGTDDFVLDGDPAAPPQKGYIQAKMGAVHPFFWEGELALHLTQCRLGRGLYLHTKWHLQRSSRLATIDMGQKSEGCAPFWGRELGPHVAD